MKNVILLQRTKLSAVHDVFFNGQKINFSHLKYNDNGSEPAEKIITYFRTIYKEKEIVDCSTSLRGGSYSNMSSYIFEYNLDKLMFETEKYITDVLTDKDEILLFSEVYLALTILKLKDILISKDIKHYSPFGL